MAKILTIIPYEFYPPRNGGSLRCFYFLRSMASEHEIYLVTVQPASDFSKDIEPAFPANVKIISMSMAKLYRSVLNVFPGKIANNLNYRLLRMSFSYKANHFYLKVYPVLKALLQKVNFDFVHYENLEVLDMFNKFMKKYAKNARGLYNAHNIDSELWQHQAKISNNIDLIKYAAHAALFEKRLHTKIDLCFCCSQSDKQKLQKLNANQLQITVIPNGVDVLLRPYDSRQEKISSKEILFCGSLDYLPNQEGLLWFYDYVFDLIRKALPGIKLNVIGTISDSNVYERLRKDSQVNFFGTVDTVIPYYKRSSVVIVPLLSGSGTRLKILEAMSMGNPVVSTSIGADGIEYKDGKHLLTADKAEDFAGKVVELMNNRPLFESLRTEALALVREKYDWNKIGLKINRSLHLPGSN